MNAWVKLKSWGLWTQETSRKSDASSHHKYAFMETVHWINTQFSLQQEDSGSHLPFSPLHCKLNNAASGWLGHSSFSCLLCQDLSEWHRNHWPCIGWQSKAETLSGNGHPLCPLTGQVNSLKYQSQVKLSTARKGPSFMASKAWLELLVKRPFAHVDKSWN